MSIPGWLVFVNVDVLVQGLLKPTSSVCSVTLSRCLVCMAAGLLHGTSPGLQNLLQRCAFVQEVAVGLGLSIQGERQMSVMHSCDHWEFCKHNQESYIIFNHVCMLPTLACLTEGGWANRWTIQEATDKSEIVNLDPELVSLLRLGVWLLWHPMLPDSVDLT